MTLLIETRELGGSGLSVSAVSIGTAALALPYGPPGAALQPPDARNAERLLTAALDRGITFIDTAPGYAGAERLVGRVVRGRECVIATKVEPPANGWDGVPASALAHHVGQSVEQSLRALGRERIDVLQAHNATQAALESGALEEAFAVARDRGLVNVLGATVYESREALATLATPEIGLVQLPYSALDRRMGPVLDEASQSHVAVVARSVLLRGVLSTRGRTLSGAFEPLARGADAFRLAVGAEWSELAGAALAFVLADARVTSALIGPRDVDELDTLLEHAGRFAGRTTTDVSALPADLLDPRRWPEKAQYV